MSARDHKYTATRMPAVGTAPTVRSWIHHSRETPDCPRRVAALEATDHLTREVIVATRHLLPAAASLGYALRECAILAHAGTAAACRESCSRRSQSGFAASDRCLKRLATWLDLAQGFGDLPTPTVLRLLEELSRCRLALLFLTTETAATPNPGPGRRGNLAASGEPAGLR